MDKRRGSIIPVLLGVIVLALIVAGAYVWGVRARGGAAAPAAAKPALIALYDSKVKGTGDPDGLLVAEVSVDAQGVAAVARCADPKLEAVLTAALSEAVRQGALPIFTEGQEASPQGESQTLSAEDVSPGQPRYAWALGGFLRTRTGLRYKLKD